MWAIMKSGTAVQKESRADLTPFVIFLFTNERPSLFQIHLFHIQQREKQMKRRASFLDATIIVFVIIFAIFGVPSFLLGQSPHIQSVTYPSSINLGDWAAIEVKVNNIGDTTSDGGISLSIPSFTSASDDTRVQNNGSSTGDSLGLLIRPSGDSIYDKNCNPMTAQYMLVEY